MKTWIISVIVLCLIGAGGWFGWKKWGTHPVTVAWRTRTIERGEIVQEVRATGTVQPIKNILVGTQVNGPILKLYADFNAEVKVGQCIAQIDPAVYEANVAKDEASLASAQASVLSAQANNQQARANVEQTAAKLALAEKELARISQMLEAKMISQSDYDTALSNRDALNAQLKQNEGAVAQTQASMEQAKASVQQSQAALRLSRANLGYTKIHSPVDGVIIERNVDEGQTVVSSMNAQTIFTIATDLTRIQIKADIPESDVGGIRMKQRVTFTVDAHSRVVFTGEVVQVRMAATTVQNVVTFPVIIEAPNPQKLLFPGMTANLAIETGRAENVLRVPSSALRFTPPELVKAASSDTGNTHGAKSWGQGRDKQKVWVLDAAGKPQQHAVKSVLSDGTWIGIEADAALEGREVVVGQVTAADAAPAENNPFAPKMPGPQMRRASR